MSELSYIRMSPARASYNMLSARFWPKSGTQHVIRGSSWRHANITQLRHSYRDFGNEGRIDVGFRIARNTDD